MLLAFAGCGPEAGAFIYFFGQPPKQVVKARFKLTTGPLLILFDDSPAVDMPPELREMAVRAIAEEFRNTKVNDKVVPPSRLAELRRKREDVTPRGVPRGIREVGRMVEAEQVLWMLPKEFAMPTTPEQVADPARLTVALKVINAKATERDQLRLWPISEDGELVSVTIPPHKVRQTKTTNELLDLIARELAVEVGRLFRDWEEGRPEDR